MLLFLLKEQSLCLVLFVFQHFLNFGIIFASCGLRMIPFRFGLCEKHDCSDICHLPIKITPSYVSRVDSFGEYVYFDSANQIIRVCVIIWFLSYVNCKS